MVIYQFIAPSLETPGLLKIVAWACPQPPLVKKKISAAGPDLVVLMMMPQA